MEMNIFLTVDYELALGPKTGTVQNCLVRPMEALMNELDNYGVKLSVMVDGAYLVRMSQLEDKFACVAKEYGEVKENLKTIHERGHSLQYHFHPQWLFSECDGEKWVLDFNHYKLSDVPKEMLMTAFCEGMNIVEGISGVRPVAFRAGGFSICEEEFWGPLFRENGILIDSSVRIGEKEKSRFQSYDFRNCPRKDKYLFSADVCNEDGSGEAKYIEMPISSSKPMPSLQYMIKKRRYSKMLQPMIEYGDGIGVGAKLTFLQRLYGLMLKFFGSVSTIASIDGFGSVALMDIYDDCKARGYENMVVLGHPKCASDASVGNVGLFVKKMIEEGNRFLTFDQISK